MLSFYVCAAVPGYLARLSLFLRFYISTAVGRAVDALTCCAWLFGVFLVGCRGENNYAFG